MYGPFGAVERSTQVEFSTQWGDRPISRIGEAEAVQAKDRGVQTHRSVRPSPPLRLLIWVNDRVESQLRAWRWGRPIQSFSLLIVMVAQAMLVSASVATDAAVRFDVPSIAVAEVADEPADHGDDGLVEIQVLVPVTSEIGAAQRDQVSEFRYDVQWQQASYPVVDYAPRTQTTSAINGTIGVETEKDHNATIGLALNGGQFGFGGSSKAEANRRDAKRVQYEEVPQHEVLVASGSIARGTGVFFRFHRSRQETLEGSRDLSMVFRVPSDWQAGLLKVKCRATGHRKVAGLWKEPIEVVRSFTLPVYLVGHPEARDRAIDFARAEKLLRASPASSNRPTTGRLPSSPLEKSVRGFFNPAGLSKAGLDKVGAKASELQSRVVRKRIPYSANTGSTSQRVSLSAAINYRNARKALLELNM